MRCSLVGKSNTTVIVPGVATELEKVSNLLEGRARYVGVGPFVLHPSTTGLSGFLELDMQSLSIEINVELRKNFRQCQSDEVASRTMCSASLIVIVEEHVKRSGLETWVETDEIEGRLYVALRGDHMGMRMTCKIR